MNRQQRKMAVAMGRKFRNDPEQLKNYVGALCFEMYHLPASPGELLLAARIVAFRLDESPSWYHGGASGLQPGEFVLPAKQTGADPRGEGHKFLGRTEFAYITHDYDYAAFYAQKCGGCVYRVRPVGKVDVGLQVLRAQRLHEKIMGIKHLPGGPHPLSLYDEFTCERAEILEVVE